MTTYPRNRNLASTSVPGWKTNSGRFIISTSTWLRPFSSVEPTDFTTAINRSPGKREELISTPINFVIRRESPAFTLNFNTE